MTLPGVETLTEDLRDPVGPSLRLATPFLVGELEYGPEAAIPIRSMRVLQSRTGARTADTAPMHDWLDPYFREGGGVAYVTPLRGPAAAAASIAVSDGTQTALTITAKDKGAAGNRLAYDIDVSGTNFEVKIYRDGTTDDHIVERSGMVADSPAAAAWSAGAKWVTITDGPGNDPAATGSPVALTGGDDDFDGITNAEIDAALARFPKTLGPGVIVLPGRTSAMTQSIAAARGKATNRLLRADAPATSDIATLSNWLTALRNDPNADIIDPLLPRLNAPGLTSSAPRTVPPSVLRCAAEARNDRAGISPNQPAAGRWGAARYLTGATLEFTDDERETLTDLGGDVVRVIDGELRVYGSRTAADPATNPAALRIGSARLRMAIIELARFEAEQTEFEEIDPGGVALGNLVGRIRSAISTYQRSLYFLDVTAELVEDELQPGVYLVEVTVEFQAAPDAERVRVTITRQVTEV